MNGTSSGFVGTIPRSFGIAFLALVVIAFGEAGMLVGRAFSSPVSSRCVQTKVAAPTNGQTAQVKTPPSFGPFTVGEAAPLSAAVLNISGEPTHLARGSRATVIVAMASWCMYCGYLDRWVVPTLSKTKGVTVDIVDVSAQGGIADPGPATPPFSGHDEQSGPLTLAGMEADMRQYATQYDLSGKAVHIYVALSATRAAWNIQALPTWAIADAAGKIAVVVPGSATVTQGQRYLQSALKK